MKASKLADFDRALDTVLKVSHAEMNQMLEAEKTKKKRKKKSKSSSSGRVSRPKD